MPGAQLARCCCRAAPRRRACASTGSNEGARRTTLPAEALARKRVDLDVGALAHGDAAGVVLVDGDEARAGVEAHDRDDRAAAGRPDQRAGIEPPLRDDAVERRVDARLAEAHRERPDLRLGRGLRGFGDASAGSLCCSSCCDHDPDGRELLGPLEVGPRERRRGFGLGQRAARRGELVGQIAGPHQRDAAALA